MLPRTLIWMLFPGLHHPPLYSSSLVSFALKHQQNVSDHCVFITVVFTDVYSFTLGALSMADCWLWPSSPKINPVYLEINNPKQTALDKIWSHDSLWILLPSNSCSLQFFPAVVCLTCKPSSVPFFFSFLLPITTSRVLVKRVLSIPHFQWSKERKEAAGWGD